MTLRSALLDITGGCEDASFSFFGLLGVIHSPHRYYGSNYTCFACNTFGMVESPKIMHHQVQQPWISISQENGDIEEINDLGVIDKRILTYKVDTTTRTQQNSPQSSTQEKLDLLKTEFVIRCIVDTYLWPYLR